MDKLTFDIETHSVTQLYNMPTKDFVRLIGYKWNDGGPTIVTTNVNDIYAQIAKADLIIGHNIIAFDLIALYKDRYYDVLKMADEGRIFDTFTHAPLAYPAPEKYVNRFGQNAVAMKPDQIRKFYKLDELAYQLGTPMKTCDLQELALQYGNPKLPMKQRINDGFGKIPTDNDTFREYLVGDVIASENLADALLKKYPLTDYAKREQRVAARLAQISLNGFRVDEGAAQARVAELEARKTFILTELQDKYGLPTEGPAPWGTHEGKAAILAAMADHGIVPNDDWPKTPSWGTRYQVIAKANAKIDELEEKIDGWMQDIALEQLPARSLKAREGWIDKAELEIEELRQNPLPPGFGLSFGGDELIALTKGTSAEDLGVALAELKGQRSLAQLALDSVHDDGFAHPSITSLQRSGRTSTTNPGLTIWTARGEGAVEKAYFIPDGSDHVLMEFDFSNADARIVAAYSGDTEFAKRFEPGQDGHMINAIAGWGAEVVGRDPDYYRQKAKIPGHGWGYGGGAKALAAQSGMDLADAEAFVKGMNEQFKGVVSWRRRVTETAKKTGFVVNDWGRRMPVEPGREYTQAPALLGQSGTREIACNFLLKLSYLELTTVKAFVHDAFVFSIPKKNVNSATRTITRKMSTSWKPKSGGQKIEFPVSHGTPAINWYEAGH